MPQQRTIPTSRSADLLTMKILIGGTEISQTIEVLSIVVEKEINRIPTAKLVIKDGDVAEQSFPVSDQELFLPGKEIEIKAGYHSDNETIFKGIIIKHNLKIRSSGSLLIIECKDLAVKLAVGRKSKYFYESKDSDILEEIIGKYSLQSDVESTNVVHQEIVQYNTSDWDFCVLRAQANGKVVIVDDGKINIQKPDFSQRKIVTVAYGDTLFEFDAEMDARTQFQKVTSYGWNFADQELMEIEANNPGVTTNGNVSASDLASTINHENLELKNGGIIPDAELQEWADAKSLFNQLSKIRGRVKFQGIPEIKPGKTIELKGVGDRFNGNAYVSAVRHQLSEGNWMVDAQLGMNPKWFSETADVNDLPAAGLLAAINGLQIGIVTQLENDPDGEDRIHVRLPIVEKESEGIWARVSTLDAGENRGSFFRPEIKDEVIVGFINGNPNNAIVLGMLNSSAKPAPIVASDDNHEKGFVTRSEMKFIFNDEKKSVVLETPGGKKITVDEDAGIIQLEDENSNIMTMDSNGITLESQGDISLKATGDIKLEGTNVNISANAQFKAEGSAGAEVSTSAVAVLKGSMVQIN
ncbi:MAG: type VI secretion system tip protein VgrG [Prolixibacteraceae bacterium]|nr:type VI secretion system tip protein VgrG [Prolixibacteraceae bacterium]